MKHKLLYSILFLALLCTSINRSYAQFTFQPTASETATTKSDSVKVALDTTRSTPHGMNIHSDAYKRYVRMKTFEYRNKVSLQSTIGITQTAFDNWAAGGTNSFSGRLWAKFGHTYINEESNFNITNVAEAAYTMMITDGVARKSEDFFYISSTPSWKLSDRWEISGSFVFKSQFTDGYTNDTIFTSSFLSPAYLTLSAGITYAPPAGRFKLYIAPISGNGTFISNKILADKGGFGVDAGVGSKTEFGAFARVEFKQPMFKETTMFETKLESFWNYADCPTLWWENRISHKLNSIFGISLYVKVIYDDSVNTPYAAENNFWQINESLGFNLTFNIKSKENKGPLTF